VAFIFKKIEAAFFGVIAVAVACANIIYITSKEIDKRRLTYSFFWLIGIIIAVLSSIVANTKNGVSISLLLFFLSGSILVYRMIFQKRLSKIKIILMGVFVVTITFGALNFHISKTHGWANIIEDMQISSKIDQHNFWRFHGHDWNSMAGEEFPKNSQGLPVAGNVYERLAWATMGVRLISQYPLGYGSINQSFVGLLDQAEIKQELESQAHSGWIDFGLAFGVPGLLILFLTFTSTVFFGLVKRDQFGLMGAWLVIGLVPFGLIAEISYKHNFEILLFFISFAATSSIGIKNANF
jgi:hypothetical protein